MSAPAAEGSSSSGEHAVGREPQLDHVRGRVVTPHGVLHDGIVTVSGGRIRSVRPTDTDGQGLTWAGTVLPGLVDIHCHGGGGAVFTEGDGEQVTAAAAHHLSQGTTSLVASMVTDSPERMLAATATAAEAVSRGEIVGLHLEGPFLSERRCGAQDPRSLRLPDVGFTEELLAAGQGHIKVMTIAPELPGAMAVAELLVAAGVTPAVGHTDADAGETEACLGVGLPFSRLGLVTHLFNGMPPLHHRSPGPVAAALATAARGQARVEVIADGTHVADQTAAMVFALVDAAGVILVSDAMAAAGMPDGVYVLGPQQVEVTRGVARLVVEDGEGSIAGSTARLLDVLRRTVQHAGVDLVRATRAAATAPAAAIGMSDEIGALEPGLRADLLVVDDELEPLRVMRNGAWVR